MSRAKPTRAEVDAALAWYARMFGERAGARGADIVRLRYCVALPGYPQGAECLIAIPRKTQEDPRQAPFWRDGETIEIREHR